MLRPNCVGIFSPNRKIETFRDSTLDGGLKYF